MSWHMVEPVDNKSVIKKIKVKIDEKWAISGEMDLVNLGKVKLQGKLLRFNSIPVQELEKEVKRPILLSAEFRDVAQEDERIFFFGNKIIKDFIKGFSKLQNIKFGEIGRNNHELGFGFVSEENGEWRCRVRVDKIQILEEQNVKRT